MFLEVFFSSSTKESLLQKSCQGRADMEFSLKPRYKCGKADDITLCTLIFLICFTLDYSNHFILVGNILEKRWSLSISLQLQEKRMPKWQSAGKHVNIRRRTSEMEWWE